MGRTRKEAVNGHVCGEGCQEAHLLVGEGVDASGWEGTAERIAVQRNSAQGEATSLRTTLETIRRLADGRRHYGGDPYSCFDALGDVRLLCDSALGGVNTIKECDLDALLKRMWEEK